MTNKSFFTNRKCFNCLFFLYALIFFTASCKEKTRSPVINLNEINEELIDANKNLIKNESSIIDSFVTAHKYRMEVTGSGLRIDLVKKTNKENAVPGDVVLLRYKGYLLDGSLCDENPKDISLSVKVGEGSLIKGLEEAILLMREGEVARLILPSYLGYGLRGDGKLIGRASVLYYELNLISIKR